MYAETLGTIFIIGAPSFFSVVWGWIGKWCVRLLYSSKFWNRVRLILMQV